VYVLNYRRVISCSPTAALVVDGVNSIGLGSESLDEKKNKLCEERKGEFDKLRKTLLLDEAGIEVKEQWLLIVSM
jgi:hypothetical protein